MSDAGARSDIEREFEEAKETARAYLRAVRVIGPDAIPKTEYREREKKIMRDTILSGWTADTMMPTDDSAYRATRLAFQYMHCGRDAEILDALLERDCSHPAYRLALELVVCGLLATGGDVPERLRRWDEEPRKLKAPVKGRWRPEPVQNCLIGMVVEMMVTGTNVLVHYEKSQKMQQHLQRDLWAVHAEGAKPIEERSIEDDREGVNKRRKRRRGDPNERRSLTQHDLVSLTDQSSLMAVGVDGIIPDVEVRRSFANLRWISGEATKDRHCTHSICDAVAEVLQEELPRKGRSERNKPWIGAVEDAWRAYRKDPYRYTN